MKNKKIYTVIVSITLIVILVIGFWSFPFGKQDFYIFADISECENIEEHIPDKSKLEIYDNPEKDPAIKDLEYESFYAAKYSSLKMDFEIFAYEFKNSEDLDEYYKNRDEYFKGYGMKTQGVFYTYICVGDENKIYSLYTKTFDENEVMEVLKECFSIIK
ncbi:MAG: hypothetical protein E7633_02955 [Ruminococcaceae bacterium]|nr:hypothetical protein [Oscillospiraceae bacterium]